MSLNSVSQMYVYRSRFNSIIINSMSDTPMSIGSGRNSAFCNVKFCKLAASRVHHKSTVGETAIRSYWRGLVRKDNILFAPDFLFAFSVTSVRID